MRMIIHREALRIYNKATKATRKVLESLCLINFSFSPTTLKAGLFSSLQAKSPIFVPAFPNAHS